MAEIDDCRIHACATVLQSIAVVDVMKPGLKASPAYAQAQRERFPNSDDAITGRGAWRSMQSTQRPVCEECCRQRDAFLTKNYPIWSQTHELAS